MANRSDNFNRADSTTALGAASDGGGSWTAHGTSVWGISSNRAYGVSGGQGVATLEASTGEVQADAVIPVVGTDYGMVIRLNDNDNYWLLALFATLWVIYRKESGGFNNVGQANVTLANGDTVRFEGSGTAIKAYQNGVQKISVTSSFNQAMTKHGLRSNGDSTARWDDFVITDLVAPTGRVIKRRRSAGPAVLDSLIDPTW